MCLLFDPIPAKGRECDKTLQKSGNDFPAVTQLMWVTIQLSAHRQQRPVFAETTQLVSLLEEVESCEESLKLRPSRC